MPIEYAPTGYGQFIQGLAAQAGQAQAGQQEAQRKHQVSMQQMSQAFQADMATLNYQMELEAAAKNKAWELEKMEIASRLDFQREMKKEEQKKDKLDLAITGLEKAFDDGQISKEQMNQGILSAQLEYSGATRAAGLMDQQMNEYQERSLGLREREIAIRENQEMTPYQERSLALQERGLDLRERELAEDIKESEARRQAAIDLLKTKQDRPMTQAEEITASNYISQFVQDVEIYEDPKWWRDDEPKKVKWAKRSDPKDSDSRLVKATEAEVQMIERLQDRLAGSTNPMEPAAPVDLEDLYKQVGIIKAVNPAAAQRHYDKFIGQFKD
jgi:hypothetical protein